MTRLVGAIVYNWPLKVMAIALATLLYGALVIAQNQQTRPVTVPIQAINPPEKTIVIGNLGEVSEIRFIEDQSGVTFASANFSASVDLSRVLPGPQAQSVRVNVESADPRIRVISWTPAFVSVKLEEVTSKDVPVAVLPGPVPSGLDIRTPVASLRTATVRGAQSDIARVTSVRAVIPVDSSGIGVDREFPLVPVDELDEQVRGVNVEPATVGVTMVVIKDQTTKSVPIVPDPVGTLAAGFEVAGVTVSAPFVSIEGDAADLANVANARTLPISVEGRTSDLVVTTGFNLPFGVTAVNPVQVEVHIVVRAVSGSRTFNTGIVLTGVRADRTYSLSVEQAQLTIGGSPVDLNRLSGAALFLNANVTDLDIGAHQVPLTISVDAGLSVLAIAPAKVTVTISPGTPPASAAPSGGG